MLQIYNTFTQKKEIFKPITPGKIGLYVCGITVYDYCHIGHARVFVAFDVITRFLRASGWQVDYVRNITDIDDKIINRANENNETYQTLTNRFIKFMHEDEARLNVERPTQEPRATEYINQIISMTQAIQDNQCAYQGENGDVYFSVDQYSKYGELSRKNLDDLQVGSRVDVAEAKHSPLDFVLWKKAKKDEPSWMSPWGDGRPGWHIECSAMATHCLGNNFDIHGGGSDLLFPHHENERAQSECATNETFANHWMHIGFVQVNKEKMSKSLNNFFTIREVLKEYDAEIIRYFLIASHYRSPVNYSIDNLEQAKKALTRMYTALNGLELGDFDKSTIKNNEWHDKFSQAMNDDFNTPQALAVLFELANKINIARKEQAIDTAIHLGQCLVGLASILGILSNNPETFLKGGDNTDTAMIEGLINERVMAKKNKDWAKADQIRGQLSEIGIIIEDGANGTTWRKG